MEILQAGTMTLCHASRFFANDSELFSFITAGVRRSIPAQGVLTDTTNADLVQSLKRAIVDHGIEAADPAEDSGLNKAYKLGFLHAAFHDPANDRTLYTFPTILHHR